MGGCSPATEELDRYKEWEWGARNWSGMGERHKMELEKVASPIREELGFHSLCTWHSLKCCEQERDVITCVKIFSLCCGGQRGGGNR